MLDDLRRDIDTAWSSSASWPAQLPEDQARAVRRFVRTACQNALELFAQLDDESRQVALRFWDDALGIAFGDTGWKRVYVWTAISMHHFALAASHGWPESMREWLTTTDTTLRGWLPRSIEANVRAAGVSGESARATSPRPERDTLSRTDLPAGIPAGPIIESPQPRMKSGRPGFRDAGDATGMHPRAGAPPSPAPPPPPESDARLYDVWFGTNRAVGNLSIPSQAFTNQRDPAGTVHYGSCSVEVPRTHTFGSTGTAWWKRWAKFQFQDDHLRVVEVVPFKSGEEFFGELRAQMQEFGPGDRQALVYIHGFNVSFEEAAIRAAQIGFDLKVAGVTSFFSWPSACDVKSYFADQDRIESSEKEIADFLVRMANNSGADAVHILAHSMGNRGLARAIQRITARAARDGAVRFGQIILAAPDISVELFRDLAAVYPTLSQRTTMYASAKDRALSLSGFLQDGFRAGYTPPTTVVNGVDTIEVTDIDLTVLGHGYYAAAEGVLYDIAQLLKSGAAPATRPRLQAVKSATGDFWKIGA